MTSDTHVAVVLAAAVTAILVTTLLPATMPWLMKHAIDVPNQRSSHASPVPRGAGAAVIVGSTLGAAAAHALGRVPLSLHAVVAGVCALLICSLGLLDDTRSLSSRTRLAVQGSMAGIVGVAFGTSFGLGALTVAAIVLAITAFVNAFNFMDGINGISGLVAAVIACWLAACGWMWDVDVSLVLASVAVAAGALAFLPWNMFRAKAFLGDSGSYGLGFSLSVLTAWAWLAGVPFVVATAPLLTYVADVGVALAMKMHQGIPWDAPHRMHVYQRLSDAGWSHPRVTAIVAACVLLAGLAGVLMTHLALLGGLTMALIVLGYLLLPRLAAHGARRPI